MRPVTRFLALIILAGVTLSTHAQDPKIDVQHRMESLYVLTKITSDRTDIVTPGSILVLHKDGLVLCSTDAVAPLTNVYKNGALTPAKFQWSVAEGMGGQNINEVKQRTFVTGEKVWIVGNQVKDDGIVLTVYSDPYQDIRYYGQVKILFNKKSVPPADDLMKTIAEVVTVDSGNNVAGNSQPPPSAPAQPPSTPKPIPPPPAPVDAPPPPPKSISLGQSRDQVVAAFGQPQKIVSLGSKEILYYPDMKVTLVNSKVTDVQ